MQTDGVQPMVTLDDCLEAEDICKADRGFAQLMRDRYDITDLATLACDPWYYGGRYSKPHAQPMIMLCMHACVSIVCCWRCSLPAFASVLCVTLVVC